MPLFEFECTECGTIEEEIVNDRNIKLSTCSVCSGVSKKIMSAAGWDIKGGGVYRSNAPSPTNNEPQTGRRRVKIG